MTKQEAILQLNSLIRDAQSHICHDGDDEIFEQDIEALNMGIEALEREEIEAEPVRYGHWIRLKSFPYGFKCSECRHNTYVSSKSDIESGMLSNHYCHNCGAKMDGGDEE